MDKTDEILIVDDTPESLRLLADLLMAEGYRVRATQDPKLAIESAISNPPRLILLDIKMPIMDGFEVCQRLKQDERTAQLPIIFVSALQETRDRVRGFEVGGVDFITKPFQREEVLARVSVQMELQRMQRCLEEQARDLSEANLKLQELDRLKSMFIASMSHELRTPLNSIIGFSGILLQEIPGELNKKQRDSMMRIQRAGRHLLTLISDIIDISKIEAERVDVFVETLSLKELVTDALETIRPLAQAKHIALSVEARSWPLLQTDQMRLLQCLLNLLSNAVKYSEDGEINVRVNEYAESIEIAVQDRGIGIEKKDLEKLFEAFERLDSHLRVKAGGTGLGLYLTKKIVTTLLQGDVRVESKYGEGSTFYLTIPKSLDPGRVKALNEREI